MENFDITVNCNIDWLSVTTEHGRGTKSPAFLLTDRTEGRGLMGYKSAYRYSSGVMHLWDDTRPDVHIIYNGATLRNLPEQFTRQWLLEWHLGAGHRVARVDTAIDVFDSGVPVTAFADDWSQNKVVTRAKTGTLISDPRGKNGDTFYVGSRKKKRKLLRIYDKAKEQGIDADWLRFEMQYNGGAARSCAKQIDGHKQLPSLFIGQLSHYARFQQPLFQHLTANIESVRVKHDMPYGQDKRVEWVLTSVVPALVQLEREQPGFMMFLASEVLERLES